MHDVRFTWPAALTLACLLGGCSRHPADDRTPAPGEDRSNGGAMWGASYFPNIPLVTHRGERVRFFDDLIKGKVVAVNFIYTRCSDACPMETARMLEVQRLLGDRLGKDVFFYSISIDPAHDTPEALAAYAESWSTGPGWTFLTGKEEDITLLRKKLGVYDADAGKKDHNLSLVIGNQKTGRWMKRSPYENPYILATQLGSWLHNWKLPGAADRNYANAPEVRNISTGEELFRGRCAACHTVGEGDRGDVEQRRVGPDLLDVTEHRDRAWLERWMMHPDEVLAEKDPWAMNMLAAYKNIVMPNLRLSRSDVDALLGYIEEESRGVARRAQLAGTAAGPVAASGPLPEPAAAGARESLTGYEAMRARLAADNLAGAQSHAAAIGDAATKASAGAGAARQGLLDLAAAARAVGAGADLAATRRSFGELSRQVVALMVGDPRLRAGRYLFLCPMASGYQKWVQTSPAIANPYWGKRMLTCGNNLTTWAI